MFFALWSLAFANENRISIIIVVVDRIADTLIIKWQDIQREKESERDPVVVA